MHVLDVPRVYYLLISLLHYRICSIRRHGYYLFHRAILRGYYSRAATIRERRLLSIRRETTTLGTSEVEEIVPFVDLDDNEDEVNENKLVAVLEDRTPLVLTVRRCARGCSRACTYHSNTSRGYYSRAATIYFRASGGAASIRERRLIESGV